MPIGDWDSIHLIVRDMAAMDFTETGDDHRDVCRLCGAKGTLDTVMVPTQHEEYCLWRRSKMVVSLKESLEQHVEMELTKLGDLLGELENVAGPVNEDLLEQAREMFK